MGFGCHWRAAERHDHGEVIGEAPLLELQQYRKALDGRVAVDAEPELGHLVRQHVMERAQPVSGTVEVDMLVIGHLDSGRLGPSDAHAVEQRCRMRKPTCMRSSGTPAETRRRIAPSTRCVTGSSAMPEAMIAVAKSVS